MFELNKHTLTLIDKRHKELSQNNQQCYIENDEIAIEVNKFLYRTSFFYHLFQ